MLRAHPDLVAALARRGITDMSRVLTDMWAYGAALIPERYRGRRLGWSDVWHRSSELGNPYAHHVTGLHPVIDLNTMTLLELEDGYEGGEAPDVMGEYLPDLIPMRLREVTPLEISQPRGVGFALDTREGAYWILHVASPDGLTSPRFSIVLNVRPRNRLSRDFGRAIIERGASHSAGGTSSGAFGGWWPIGVCGYPRGLPAGWRRPPPSRSGRPASSRITLGRVLLSG
jgi:hypothetical protein